MKKMKKVFALLVMFLLVGAMSADAAVGTKEIGATKVHTFSNEMGGNAVVVENKELVVLDAFGTPEDNAKFKAFIDSLNKPVARVFISHSHDHHWTGIEKIFPNTQFYSVDAAIIKKDAAGASVPVNEIADGKITVDGVEYEFVTYKDLGAWVIKMPAAKVAMVHHLGYIGVHVPIPPLEKRLAILNDLEKDGFTWFIGGHGAAADAGTFNKEVAAYYKVVAEAVAASKTPADAKKIIVEKFPKWGGDRLLDIFLPLFY